MSVYNKHYKIRHNEEIRTDGIIKLVEGYTIED